MKLAFALYKYFPFGGLQRNMLAMALEAIARGHEVTIYCSDWQGECPANIEVQLIPSRGWDNAARMQNFASDLQPALKAHDLLVGFNKWPGLDLYYAADSCFAYKAHCERGFLYRQAPRTKAYLKLEKAVFGSASKTQILEVSRPERERFVQCYATVESRFNTLPPGIATNRVAPSNWRDIRRKSREQLQVAEGQSCFLALGSGYKTKGLDRSINALHTLCEQGLDGVLLVVGEDKRESFVRQAEKIGLKERVRFLGGRDDVPNLLQAADVLLHPAYKENTGNALLEAMIAGLPVVTSDVCGYAHYVKDAAMGAVLASPFSGAAYVAAISEALAVPAATWHQKGEYFAANSDVYSRPQVAVDIMEDLAERRERVQ
ncbi:MAG: glycosyltransferase family 4 protein [Gammaproteobacteria bacterium]|nr:glycosyltransferase family 4 protein [Gammaproteobacteria bacterium]